MVLGMHRSGTSAITRVLNLLGCALSENLLAASFGNEKGHWEAMSVVELNDTMLASAGTVWNDCNPINDDWRSSAIFAEMVTRATDILRDHALQGPLFAYKDPRACLLADVWLEASREAGIAPLAVLMIRNPAEVVGSLQQRDLMKDGYAELLWLRYILDAEFLTRGCKRTFCRYDQLLGNWRQLVDSIKKDLDIALPRNSAKVHREIEGFLQESFRHHQVDNQTLLEDLGYSEWLRQIFGIMLRWSDEGEDESDHAKLDLIRSEFDRACAALARVVRGDEFAGEAGAAGQLKAELEQLCKEKAQAEVALRTAEENLEQQRAAGALRETDLEQQLETTKAALDTVKTETQQSRQDYHKQLETAQQTLEALTAENARIQADAQSQIEAAVAATHTANTQIDQLREASETQIAEQKALSSQLEQANRSLEEQLETTLIDLATARANAAKAADSHAEAAKQVEKLQHTLSEEKARTAELGGKLAILQSTLAQRDEELAQVWDKLLIAQNTSAAAQTEATQEHQRRVAEEQRSTLAESRLNDERSRFSDEIAKLTDMLRTQDQKAQETAASSADTAAELARIMAEHAGLKEEIKGHEAALRSSEAALDVQKNAVAQRFDEIARITSLLAEESEQADGARANAQWLGSVTKLTATYPAWWALMTRKWRAKRQHQRLKRSGLFDAQAYLEMYPDVAAFGMDPFRHYILHGMEEQRSRPQ